MKRRTSADFSTESFVEADRRGYGVVNSPNGHVAIEYKTDIDRAADALLKKARKQPRRMTLYSGTRAQIGYILGLFQGGYSIRRIAVITGVSRMTVQKHLRRVGVVRGKCLCGQSGGHQGWCSFRVSISPKRQEFLRQRWGKLGLV
jgi:hypothetical protein